MFREMRRKRQALPQETVDAVLKRGTSGVLALSGDDGYPYAVPISYVYDGKVIYFHCAKAGHKLDSIRRDEKASFCVIDKDEIVPEKYTTYFRSVIAFGRMHEVTDDAEKRSAIEALCIKYAPDDTPEGRNEAIEREWTPLCVLRLDIDHMTGKEAIELVRSKQEKKD
ncbi:MAG: pyridoxamine 5'-phosphate oxidase family protein [Lachnospiraceae bacterium]